ncbi:MAG: carbon monoxide dehydrogenase subunit G [Rhodospirillaceae bacterium]|nr:carbon monoxide dehydrogenase subunit G [Rhodospirillaceae bacterium]
MDMSGERHIPAPRETVWKALNDPEVLKQCIPGCEEIAKASDTEFTAKVLAKVGPVKARFSGKVTLSDLDPPNAYKINGEGQGGAAGFAKGGAVVTLEPGQDGGTVMRYTVHAAIGGKLAQIGSRLIDGTARKLADQFFDNLVKAVGGEGPAALSADDEDGNGESAGPSLSPAVWIPALIGAIGLLLGVFGTA